MHARPQGRLLIAALLGNGVKHVIAYDAKRIGRTQPPFWSFIGMSRDNGITVLDSTGTDLGGSMMGKVNARESRETSWTSLLPKNLPALTSIGEQQQSRDWVFEHQHFSCSNHAMKE